MTTALHPGAKALLEGAQAASRALAQSSAQQRDDALAAISLSLVSHSQRIVAANALDLARGASEAMAEGIGRDRLRLTPERVTALSDAVTEIRALPESVGDVVRGMTLPNGLQVSQVRVPFGVVGANL